MKKFVSETGLILLLSLVCALVFNYLLSEPLPLFRPYDPLDSDRPLIAGEQPFIDEIEAQMIRILQQQDQIVLLDARKETEYRTGHIPGALSLPVDRFDRLYPMRSDLFMGNRIIATYCSERHCIDALQLARKLFHRGHENVFVFLGGMEEWTRLEFPVETDSESSDYE